MNLEQLIFACTEGSLVLTLFADSILLLSHLQIVEFLLHGKKSLDTWSNAGILNATGDFFLKTKGFLTKDIFEVKKLKEPWFP